MNLSGAVINYIILGKCVKWLLNERSQPGPWSCNNPPTHPQAECPEGTLSDPSAPVLVETNRPPERDETTRHETGSPYQTNFIHLALFKNSGHRLLDRRENRQRIKKRQDKIKTRIQIVQTTKYLVMKSGKKPLKVEFYDIFLKCELV